jgi:hypothetical protein
MMMSCRDDGERENVLSEDQVEILNDRQREIYSDKIARFAEYLREQGKEPRKGIGYPEKSVSERISRFHRIVKWVWNNEEITIEIAPEHADRVNEGLASDSLRRYDGNPYKEGSKRKINDVLTNWFEFQGIDWEPEFTFSDNDATENADPFSKRELRLL